MMRWRTLDREDVLRAVKQYLNDHTPVNAMQIEVLVRDGHPRRTFNDVPIIRVGYDDQRLAESSR